MIVEFLAERAQGDPIVVTGDLNATPESEPLSRLLGQGALRDSFHFTDQAEGTFHGYTGQATGRIDYILVGADVRVGTTAVVKDQPLGIWPSDHYPIYAEIEVE